MSTYAVEPIGVVRCTRTVAEDDDWDAYESAIELDGERFEPSALAGLDAFSHVEVVYLFDRVDPGAVETAARRPRNNPDWPMVGVFAQRAKRRPNRLGVTRCALLAIEGLTVRVRGLDAIDGTPVLDLKPHMTQFDARGAVHQPVWVDELMAGYW